MKSKRPKNNFDNSFARSIFKTDLRRGKKGQEDSSNAKTSNKSTHSSINDDLGSTPPIEGEA